MFQDLIPNKKVKVNLISVNDVIVGAIAYGN